MNAIKYTELNHFFSTIGKSLNTVEFDKQYLWMGLYICNYMAFLKKEGENDLWLDEQFFINSLHVDNLAELQISNKVPEKIKYYSGLLKEKILTDNIVGSLLFVIQNELRKNEIKTNHKKNNKKFTKNHLIKTLKITAWGAITTAVYYSTNNQLLTCGVGVGLVLLNSLTNKVRRALKETLRVREEKNAIKNATWSKNYGYQHIAKLNNMGNWGELSFLTPGISELLNETKLLLVKFSSLYPQKKRLDNIYMENDVVKINEKDIPSMLEGIKRNVYDVNIVKDILVKMNKKLTSHIDVLLEQSEMELKVTQKYWEMKSAEGSFAEIENIIEPK